MLVATLIRSRRLDIRKVPFLRFYEPIRVENYKNAKEKNKQTKKTTTTRRRPKSCALDRTSLVNDGVFIRPKPEVPSCGTTTRNPERGREVSHLARSESQSERKLQFILPARETSHIITPSTREIK